MTVEYKSFGTLIIDGKEYSSDVIIYPDGKICDSWKRKKRHRLFMDDITDLIASEPKIIIAGTGKYGILKPEKGLRGLLEKKGINFFAYPIRKAVREYNKICGKIKVGVCFHLSC
jgi:hypothetical protein